MCVSCTNISISIGHLIVDTSWITFAAHFDVRHDFATIESVWYYKKCHSLLFLYSIVANKSSIKINIFAQTKITEIENSSEMVKSLNTLSYCSILLFVWFWFFVLFVLFYLCWPQSIPIHAVSFICNHSFFAAATNTVSVVTRNYPFLYKFDF